MDTIELNNYKSKVNTSTDPEKKWRVELYNRDTFYLLYDLLKISPDDEYKIIAKLKEFEQAITSTIKPYRALMIDFRKFKYSGSRGVGLQTERGVASGASRVCRNYQDVEDQVEWSE